MDILSGDVDSSGEFSGFSDNNHNNLQLETQENSNDIVVVVSENISKTAVSNDTIPRVKVSNSKKQKGNDSNSKKKEKTKKKSSASGTNFDISKLSSSDLASLRQALGIDNVQEHEVPEYDSEEADYYQSPLGALENIPNNHAEISDS